MTMNTKQEQWREHIAACTSSGLSIHEWCKVNAVSSDNYHYWKRKLNKQESPSLEDQTQWASLLIEKPQNTLMPAQSITLQAGTFKVDVTQGFDKQTLTELLQVLSALC